jgi:hypothetical protein
MLDLRDLKWAAAPALLLLVSVAGCGSSGGNGTSNGAAGGSGQNAQPASGGNFCQVFRDELNGLNAAFPKDLSSAEQLKAYGQFLEDSNAKLLAAAPGEIRAALEAQVKVSNATAAAYKNGKPPTADVTAQLRSPEYQNAAKQVTAYARDKCGISPSAPTS